MNGSTQYLLTTLFSLIVSLFLLRAWFQFVRIDFYHSLSQSLVKITNPILLPLYKIFPNKSRVDIVALFIAWSVAVLSSSLYLTQIWDALPTALLFGVFKIVKTIGTILVYALFISAILSWVSRANDPLTYILYAMTEPFLRPIRKLLPRTGSLDFSPMILMFILFYFNHLTMDLLEWSLGADYRLLWRLA